MRKEQEGAAPAAQAVPQQQKFDALTDDKMQHARDLMLDAALMAGKDSDAAKNINRALDLLCAAATPAVQVIDAPRVAELEGWRASLEHAANKLVTQSRILAPDGETLRLITELRAISEALDLPIARQAQPTGRDAEGAADA